MRATLVRTADIWRTHHFELSSALYQRNRHGRSSGPEHHIEGPATPHPPSSADLQASLRATQRLASGAAARTVAAPSRRRGAVHNATFAFDALDSLQDVQAYLQHRFEVPPADRRQRAALDTLAMRSIELAGGARRLRPDAARPDRHTVATGAALFADALHASGARDVHSALRVLDHIELLDLNTAYSARSQGADFHRAWHAVRLLARSPAGFDILANSCAAAGRSFARPLHRDAVRMLLHASDVLAPLHTGAPDPAYDPAPGTVAMGAGLPATAADPGGPHALARRAFDAAATLLQQGPVALTPAQREAFFDWRQGFTDDSRGSELSRVRERLHKFCSSTARRVGRRRWTTALPRMLAGRMGSPLDALRLGTQGVPRTTLAREQAAFRQGLRDALPALLASPALQTDAALAHARPERSLLELAALHIWLERGGFAHRRLDGEGLATVAQRALTMCETLRQQPAWQSRIASGDALGRRLARARRRLTQWSALPGSELARLRPFKPLARRRFDVNRLAAWARFAHLPEDAPLWQTLPALYALERPDVTERANDNLDDVRATLIEAATNLRSGQQLVLSDGGRQGVSTNGLGVVVDALVGAHAVPVSARLDLRAARGRMGVVALRRSTHGVDIFIGTTRTRLRHAGAGAMVGYDLNVGLTQLRAGIVADAVLHSRELAQPCGVTLRVTRPLRADGTGYDDSAMLATFGELIGHLFDEAARPSNDGARALWQRLANLCWDRDSVSVGWTALRDDTRRRSASADLALTVEAGGLGQPTLPDAQGHRERSLTVRAGPSAGIVRTWTRQTFDSDERSGAMRIEQHQVGHGRTWHARTGIAPGLSHPLDATGRMAIDLFSIDAPTATVTFSRHNQSANMRLVRDRGGQLNHRASLLDVEYLDPHTYRDAIDAVRPHLLRLFAEDEIDRHRQRTGERLPPALAWVRAARRIDAHLASVRTLHGTHLIYLLRWRLREHAARRIDANSARLAQYDGEPTMRAQVELRNQQILDDLASWMPIELKMRERSTRGRSFGPTAVVQLNTRVSATGIREIVTENTSLGVLDRLDRQLP